MYIFMDANLYRQGRELRNVSSKIIVHLPRAHQKIDVKSFLFFRIVVIILNNFHFDLSGVPKQLETELSRGVQNVKLTEVVQGLTSIFRTCPICLSVTV